MSENENDEGVDLYLIYVNSVSEFKKLLRMITEDIRPEDQNKIQTIGFDAHHYLIVHLTKEELTFLSLSVENMNSQPYV